MEKSQEIRLSDWCVQYRYNDKLPFVPFYGDIGQDLFGNFWDTSTSENDDESRLTFYYKGCVATNVECLYQASKFSHIKDLSKKFNNLPADQAFKLSRIYETQHKIIKDWHYTVKFKVMMDLLRMKFSYPLYRKVLLATNDKYLVEHNPVAGRDHVWSDGHDGTGLNKLGEMLMELRGEFGGTGVVKAPKEYYGWLTSETSKCGT
jgi:ribA/ribD-fused uncharacterized protein